MSPSSTPNGALDEAEARRQLDALNFFAPDPVTIDEMPRCLELVRRVPGIYRDPRAGAFMVTRYETVRRIALDHERFSSINSVSGPELGAMFQLDPTRDMADQVASLSAVVPVPVMADPPTHTRQRALVARLFTPRRMKELEGPVQSLAEQLADRLVAQPTCEFVDAFANPFAFLVIAELLGIPETDRSALYVEFREHFSPGEPGTMTQFLSWGMVAAQHLYRYLDERRRQPAHDYLTRIATATNEDGTLPEIADLVGAAIALFGAGQETAARTLSSGMHLLATRPDVADLLRREPDRLGDFAEEVIRLWAPAKAMFRLALVDAEVDGTRIPAGSTVMLSYAGANLDPDAFSEPDEFRLDRRGGAPSMAFGHGPHYCIGASLARLETRIAFAVLLDRLHDIRLDPAAPPRLLPSYIIQGLAQLGLRYRADLPREPVTGREERR